jgi:hypothetical protein
MASFANIVMTLERNMHVVQAALLTLLIALIVYYRIALGRNLLGLLWGYSLYVSTSVAILTLRTVLGPSSQGWLDLIRQACVIVGMFIWVATLRSYHPMPKPEVEIGLEQDYLALAQRTSKVIATARTQILKVFTP